MRMWGNNPYQRTGGLLMKTRIISSPDYLLRIHAEDELERKLLEEYWKNGIRVTGAGNGSLTICSPATAGVIIHMLTEEEEKVLMKALITYKKSELEAKIVDKLLLELVG